VSFILDALKKLEREKDEREPGVVLVGPVPWGERDPRRRGAGLAVAGAVLAVVLGGTFLWLRSGSESPAPRTGGEGTAGPSATVTPGPTGPGISEANPTAPARARDGAKPEAPPPPAVREPAPVDAVTPTSATEGMASAQRPPSPLVPGDPLPPETPATSEPRDEPTKPAAVAPEFRLTAISSRDGHPIALLNDRLVREGDRFGDITILEIGETSVEIEVNGKRQTVGF
jgi:hypothetical protein